MVSSLWLSKKFNNPRAASQIEVFLISLTFFCLPIFEAPKNAFSILFLAVWCFYTLSKRSLGSASILELPIMGLAAILWIAPLFSHFGDIITPLDSGPRWTLLAFFVLTVGRLDYSREQAICMIAALMAGGIFAVLESFWVWSFNGKPYPEFRSVGHVNHSSMYTLVTFAAGIGSLYLRSRWLQALGAVAIISTLLFLPPSRSLVGAISVVIILVVAVGLSAARSRSIRGFIFGSGTLLVLIVGVLASPPATDIRTELMSRITGDDMFSSRDKILNSALAVWYEHPVLGTGWSSFGVATSEEQVRAALVKRGEDYNPVDYGHHAHGHNLWTTILIERGLLGVCLVTALLTLYFWKFTPLAIGHLQLGDQEYGFVLAALLVAVGFVVAGMGNTTMMNEHGHAGMALISVCLGHLRERSRF